MIHIDMEKLIQDTVRYDVEIDIRIGGYLKSGVPNLHDVATIEWKDLTKEEAEALINTIAYMTKQEE